MPQSQDIHLNNSETYRGPTARTAGQGTHLDAYMRLWQDMHAPAHVSLAQEMHAPKLLPGACIACTPQLKVYRPPNRTLINHYSIQMPPKCSREEALHTDNRPRRMQWPRCPHL